LSLSRFCHYDLPEYGQNTLVFLAQDTDCIRVENLSR
jgi:hypothetical protein